MKIIYAVKNNWHMKSVKENLAMLISTDNSITPNKLF